MIWIAAYLGSVIGAFLTIVVMTMIRNEYRHSIGRLGWLGLTLLSPPVAFVLFFFLAGRRVSAEHDRRDTIAMPDPGPYAIELDEPDRYRFGQLLERRGISATTRGSRVELIDSPADHYRRYLELFRSAEESIYVMTFVAHNDELFTDMMDIWIDKAKSGVQVCVLVDGFGSVKLRNAEFDGLRAAGGKAAIFKPMTRPSRLSYLNLRDHRKIAVVDGRRGILGGANLVDYQITTRDEVTAAGEKIWDDLSLSIEGPATVSMQSVFCSDWNFVTDEDLPPPELRQPVPADRQRWNDTPSEFSALTILPVGPDAPHEILDDFWLYAIHSAKKTLRFVTPYFVPPTAVHRSLESACRRGVDVQLIIPETSDLAVADYARLDYLRDLVEDGVRVFRYQPRMLHAKVGIVDDEIAVVGSANFDVRSFFLNYECSAVIHDHATVSRVIDWFDARREQCAPGMADLSLSKRFLGVAARLFASEL